MVAPTIPALIIIFVIGFAAIVWYRPEIHLLERLGLAYLLGTAIVTFTMFWLSVIGVGFKFIVLLPVLIIVSIVSLVYAAKKGRIQTLREQLRGLPSIRAAAVPIVTAVVLGAIFLIALSRSGTVPVIIGADTLGRQAPVIAMANDKTVQTDAYALLQIPHPEYPLQVPLISVFALLFRSDTPAFYDVNINILFGFYFVALVTIFYFRVKDLVRFSALASVSAIVLATTPFILNASWAYSHHFPASVFAVAGVIYFYCWYRNGQAVDNLWLAGILLGCFAWTRLDGLLFALAPLTVSAIVLLRLRARGQASIAWQFFVPYMILAFAWPIYRHVRWTAYGPLAIYGNSDLILMVADVMLIASYFAAAAFITRFDWIKRRIDWIILLTVALSIVGFVAVTQWRGSNIGNLTGARLQILGTDMLLPEWGALAITFLAFLLVLKQLVQRWYLTLVVLWSFMLWGVIYIWDLTGTWPNPNNFGGLWGSANRSLLYIYPLVLFAVTYFLAPKPSDGTVETR